jgi:hypothetical protein
MIVEFDGDPPLQGLCNPELENSGLRPELVITPLQGWAANEFGTSGLSITSSNIIIFRHAASVL